MLKELDNLDTALKFLNVETDEEAAVADNLYRALCEARRVFGLEFEGEDTIPETLSLGLLAGVKTHLGDRLVDTPVGVGTLEVEIAELFGLPMGLAKGALLRLASEGFLLPVRMHGQVLAYALGGKHE